MIRFMLLGVGSWLVAVAVSFGQGGFPTPWGVPVSVDAMWPAPSGCGKSPVIDPADGGHDLGCAECGECFATPLASGYTYWAEGDFLAWWTRGINLPPLVTTSPSITNRANAGVLGKRRTTNIFGGTDVDDDIRLGGRVILGFWCGPEQRFAVFGEFFGLENENTGFLATTTDTLRDEFLARPFFNVNPGVNDAYLVAVPGLQEGSIGVQTYSRLYGAGLWGRQFLCGCNNWRLDLVGGYRYLYLGEQLAINSTAVLLRDISVEVPGPDEVIPAGTQTKVLDRFRTRNQFHGEDLGLRYDWRSGPFSMDLTGKLGFGFNFSRVDIRGRTTFTEPGQAADVAGEGLLALRSNSGGHKKTQFAVVPSVALNFGYQLTQRLRASFGYDFLWWTEVARPGEQIDLRLNPTIIPPNTTRRGPLAPIFQFEASDFWAQGLNAALEFRY